MVLQRLMGLKSFKDKVLGFLGIRQTCVRFIFRGIQLVENASKHNFSIELPIIFQYLWKKIGCNPSGPGTLRGWKEWIIVKISSLLGIFAIR